MNRWNWGWNWLIQLALRLWMSKSSSILSLISTLGVLSSWWRTLWVVNVCFFNEIWNSNGWNQLCNDRWLMLMKNKEWLEMIIHDRWLVIQFGSTTKKRRTQSDWSSLFWFWWTGKWSSWFVMLTSFLIDCQGSIMQSKGLKANSE